MESNFSFLDHLREEKLQHKQHRIDLVKQKLIFMVGLFGIGSIKIATLGDGAEIGVYQLLLLVPMVAFAFDIYIFAEDFKVKRVGDFILNKCEATISLEEKKWEEWLSIPQNRERLASMGSGILTFLLLIAATIIYPIEMIESKYLFYWYFGSLLIISVGFYIATFLRNELILKAKNFASPKVLLVLVLFVVFSLISIFSFYLHEFFNLFDDPPKEDIFIFGSWLVAVIYSIIRLIVAFWRRCRIVLVNVPFEYLNKNKDEIREAYLVGDFTEWHFGKIPMKEIEVTMETQTDNGIVKVNRKIWIVEVALPPGKDYQWKTFILCKDGRTMWYPECKDGQVVPFNNNVMVVREKEIEKKEIKKKSAVQENGKKVENDMESVNKSEKKVEEKYRIPFFKKFTVKVQSKRENFY